MGKGRPQSSARAIAVSAIRETREETGLALHADLSLLRLVARAVTPPIYPHRYDTHFFAAFRDEALEQSSAAAASFQKSFWIWTGIRSARPRSLALPDITRIILEETEARLFADPLLESDLPIPFFAMRQRQNGRTAY